MEHLFLQTLHQNHQLRRRMTTGHLSHPGLALNLRSSFLPTPNSHRGRSTSSSNFGLPHSSPTTTLHPSPITEIFTSKLTQSSSATSSGKIVASSMKALPPKRLVSQNGRLRSMTFGIGTLVKSSRISWPIQTLMATLTTWHTRSSMASSDGMAM